MTVIAKDGSIKTTQTTQDHAHSATGDGGQLDWDNAFSDAVHNHSSDAEGGDVIDLNGTGELILDADGDTKIYSTSDDTPVLVDGALASAEQRLGSISNGITVTVKTSGGDFSTIQSALDYFKSNSVSADVTINVDAGLWAENISIDGLLSTHRGSITLQGDTRFLAGIPYLDGAVCNGGGAANGGTGTVTLSNSGNNVTVAMSTTNPDFDADGWGNGDTLYSINNTGTPAFYTISSVSNNVITLSTTAPSLGTDGSVVALVPNREIDPTGTDTVFNAINSNLTIIGFHLQGPVAGTAAILATSYNSTLRLRSLLIDSGYYGILCTGNSTILVDWGSALIANNTLCWYSISGGFINANYAGASKGSYGFYADRNGQIEAYGAVASKCTIHYNTASNGYGYYVACYARNNGGGTGFQAAARGYTLASSTNTRHNVATAYSPAPTIPGYAQGGSYGVLYASN